VVAPSAPASHLGQRLVADAYEVRRLAQSQDPGEFVLREAHPAPTSVIFPYLRAKMLPEIGVVVNHLFDERWDGAA
jgi:hypothetical protein